MLHFITFLFGIVLANTYINLEYKDTLKLSWFDPLNMTTRPIKDFGIKDYVQRGNCFVDTTKKNIYFENAKYLYKINYAGSILSYTNFQISYPCLINDTLYGLASGVIVEVGYNQLYDKYNLDDAYERFSIMYVKSIDTYYVWFNYYNDTNLIISLKNWNIVNTYYLPMNLEGSYAYTSLDGVMIYMIGSNRKSDTNILLRLNTTSQLFDYPITYHNMTYALAFFKSGDQIYSVMESNLISGVYFWVVTNLNTMTYTKKLIPLDTKINCIGVMN